MGGFVDPIVVTGVLPGVPWVQWVGAGLVADRHGWGGRVAAGAGPGTRVCRIA
ncbi:hypothetical protein GCM10010532_066650 [Dactylosporangium siamense]|uniref:Uncharacterized protein n=1 Tax=Dactylosporangium siamense TaxID=685454 RepID=A0A919UCU7_9ACTN|nr:hypothetical protein Dsi01nite_050310 [Dactylosporangium siamense]